VVRQGKKGEERSGGEKGRDIYVYVLCVCLSVCIDLQSTVPGVIYICRDATQDYEEAYFGEREEAREGR
jgi:hypothetical protein